MNLLKKQKQFAAKSIDTSALEISAEAELDFKFAGAFSQALSNGLLDTYYHNKDALPATFKLIALGRAYEDHYLRQKGDTPYSCSTKYYASVVEDLGFEKVAAFKLDQSKATYRSKNAPKKETVFVYARPDGFVLTWDTYCGKRNGAKLSFQRQALPEQRSLGSADGNGTNFREEGKPVLFSGYLDAREGLREQFNKLTDGSAAILSPWDKTAREKKFLVVEQDYGTIRDLKGLDNRGKDFDTLCGLVADVQEKREKALPLWVRQMTGLARMKTAP